MSWPGFCRLSLLKCDPHTHILYIFSILSRFRLLLLKASEFQTKVKSALAEAAVLSVLVAVVFQSVKQANGTWWNTMDATSLLSCFHAKIMKRKVRECGYTWREVGVGLAMFFLHDCSCHNSEDRTFAAFMFWFSARTFQSSRHKLMYTWFYTASKPR